MKRKKFLLIAFIIIMGTFGTTKVEAALQSRPGVTTLGNQTADQFFEKIRNMEAEGGTLGKEANIDGTSFLDSSGNGVDVHMAKNTEWGTAAMLAASAYGLAPSGQSNASTTGNATGIYQMADGNYDEYVAGIYDISKNNTKKIKASNTRYYDLYKGNGTSFAKLGDATTLAGWKNANNWAFITSANELFERGYSSLFGYCCDNGHSNASTSSRAVLVLGAGL